MELVKFGKLKEQSYTMKESLRALKTNIQFCGDDIRTLLVTSSVPNEGKSTVALDLARSLTESGNRVLFIDTDMRKSVLAGRLRATAASGGEICGLSHYLSGQRRLEEVMYGTEIPGLFMIFAGPSVPNPTEILEKKYFQELLNFGKEHFNYIIIDCAPIGAAIDAAVVAKYCDGAIIVIGHGERQDDSECEKTARGIGSEDTGGCAQQGKQQEKQPCQWVLWQLLRQLLRAVG